MEYFAWISGILILVLIGIVIEIKVKISDFEDITKRQQRERSYETEMVSSAMESSCALTNSYWALKKEVDELKNGSPKECGLCKDCGGTVEVQRAETDGVTFGYICRNEKCKNRYWSFGHAADSVPEWWRPV